MEKALTFEEFQATRRFVPDANKHEACHRLGNYQDEDLPKALRPRVQPCLIYRGDLVIGLVTEGWPWPARRQGAYNLVIGNQDQVSDDLERLERELYDFWRGEHLSPADRPTRTYRTEFPDFDYELPSLPGFTDESWKNDMMPVLRSKERRVAVWCDYADLSKRDAMTVEGKRFTVQRTDEHGALTDEPSDLFETDSELDLRAWLAVHQLPLTEEQWRRHDELAAGIEESSAAMAVVDYYGRLDQRADGAIYRIGHDGLTRLGVRDIDRKSVV